MKMILTFFAAFLLVTLFLQSPIAVQTKDTKNPKLSETPSRLSSPQLYVFGGQGSRKCKEPCNPYENESSASHFNSSTNKWEAITAMSKRRAHFCGAVVGTKIYLFGGEGDFTETSEVYDCETGNYSSFQSMPEKRYGCSAAVLGDYIYVAGGLSAASAVASNKSSTPLSSVFRYNIQTTKRENVRSMHNARYDNQLVELNDRLYAIGGHDTKTVEAYNATTDQWIPVASTNYEHAHLSFGATVHEGKIYVCSGSGCEMYSSDADQWESLTVDSSNPFTSGSAMVSMNGELWTLGGGSGPDPASNVVYTYNTATKKWTKREHMDVNRKHFCAFVVNH